MAHRPLETTLLDMSTIFAPKKPPVQLLSRPSSAAEFAKYWKTRFAPLTSPGKQTAAGTLQNTVILRLVSRKVRSNNWTRICPADKAAYRSRSSRVGCVALKVNGWSRLRDIRSFDCWWGDFSTSIEDYNSTPIIFRILNFFLYLFPCSLQTVQSVTTLRSLSTTCLRSFSPSTQARPLLRYLSTK
jgi:hypothetical protein